jgi:hypothetical protein
VLGKASCGDRCRRSVGERVDQRLIEDRILSEPDWAIARVMAENENELRPQSTKPGAAATAFQI